MLYKKVIIFLLITSVVILQGFALKNNKVDFETFKNYKAPQLHYYFLSKFEEESVFSGIYFLIENSKLESYDNVVGQMLIYDKGEIAIHDVVCFFDAKIVKKEKLKQENIKIFYLYSYFLDNETTSRKVSFNLQLIFNSEKVFLCYPINFASF